MTGISAKDKFIGGKATYKKWRDHVMYPAMMRASVWHVVDMVGESIKAVPPPPVWNPLMSLPERDFLVQIYFSTIKNIQENNARIHEKQMKAFDILLSGVSTNIARVLMRFNGNPRNAMEYLDDQYLNKAQTPGDISLLNAEYLAGPMDDLDSFSIWKEHFEAYLSHFGAKTDAENISILVENNMLPARLLDVYTNNCLLENKSFAGTMVILDRADIAQRMNPQLFSRPNTSGALHSASMVRFRSETSGNNRQENCIGSNQNSKRHSLADRDRVCFRCNSTGHFIRDCTVVHFDLPKKSGVKRKIESQPTSGRGSEFLSNALRGIPGGHGLFPGNSGWQPWTRSLTTVTGASYGQNDSLGNNRGGVLDHSSHRLAKMRHVASATAEEDILEDYYDKPYQFEGFYEDENAVVEYETDATQSITFGKVTDDKRILS